MQTSSLQYSILQADLHLKGLGISPIPATICELIRRIHTIEQLLREVAQQETKSGHDDHSHAPLRGRTGFRPVSRAGRSDAPGKNPKSKAYFVLPECLEGGDFPAMWMTASKKENSMTARVALLWKPHTFSTTVPKLIIISVRRFIG